MGGRFQWRALSRARAAWAWPPIPKSDLPNPCDLCHLCIAGRGRGGGKKYGVRWDGIRGRATYWAPPERINHLCFPIRWRDWIHRDSSKPAAESQGPRSDIGLPKAGAGSDHVGMSILWKLWGKAWFLGAGRGPTGTVLFLTG